LNSAHKIQILEAG